MSKIPDGTKMCPRRWKTPGKRGVIREHACTEPSDHVAKGQPHLCGGCGMHHQIDEEDRK